MRVLIVLVLLLTLFLPASGQDDPLPPMPRIMPLEVIKAKKDFKMTDRVIFVMDTSGSMTGELKKAIDCLMLIAGSPSDDLRVGLITFTHTADRWKGVPECLVPHTGHHLRKCIPPQWAAMPSSLSKLYAYLASLEATGGTNPGPAILEALKDPEKLLTVVLISDGGFHDDMAVNAWKSGQELRKKRKLPPAKLMIWGAGTNCEDSESAKNMMGDLAKKIADGGLWANGFKENKSGPW